MVADALPIIRATVRLPDPEPTPLRRARSLANERQWLENDAREELDAAAIAHRLRVLKRRLARLDRITPSATWSRDAAELTGEAADFPPRRNGLSLMPLPTAARADDRDAYRYTPRQLLTTSGATFDELCYQLYGRNAPRDELDGRHDGYRASGATDVTPSSALPASMRAIRRRRTIDDVMAERTEAAAAVHFSTPEDSSENF